MADTNEWPMDSAMSKADAMALAEQAEAEAAEAEALAAAARARARAIRLRREAQAQEAARAAAEESDSSTTDAAPITDASTEATETRKVTESGEVAETGESDATGAPPTSEPTPWRRRLRMPRLSTSAKAAAIIAICGLLGASGYILWHHHDVIQQRQRAAAFAAGARQGVINLTSLDFKKAKQDVQRVLDSSTGEFRDDFQQRAPDFTTVVEQSKVVTEGTVNSAAVESMGKNSAVVLVSATSRVTNSAGAKEDPRAWRLRVTVSDDGGQMKMSKVEFVP